MNPWDIVSWIGAICVAVFILALTVGMTIAVVASLIKTPRGSTKNILRGR